jgi:2-polyprenyl-3-methyl-5-hydroxy-6-metoxy-1,4-benzoquinol methylase
MNCRVCDSEDMALYYTQGFNGEYKYYRCKNCGLVNLDLNNLNIIDNQQQFADRFKPPVDHENEKGALDAYRFITKYVPVKGKHLDIGCGGGSLLYFTKKYGWVVKGLELSPVFAEYIKKTMDIDVEIADFLKYEGSKGQYDLVSLRHVLEHLPDSVLALNKIKNLLKEKGYAHFEFPNINSLSHHYQRIRAKIPFLRKKYSPSYTSGHCNQFSKKAFVFLLQMTGFKLIRWETYSFKPVKNYFFNHIHIGTKARAIVQRTN